MHALACIALLHEDIFPKGLCIARRVDINFANHVCNCRYRSNQIGHSLGTGRTLIPMPRLPHPDWACRRITSIDAQSETCYEQICTSSHILSLPGWQYADDARDMRTDKESSLDKLPHHACSSKVRIRIIIACSNDAINSLRHRARDAIETCG